MQRPLEGLRIVELARVLAGPWAGQTLADLGAEVIKIESPQGDDTRKLGAALHRARGRPFGGLFPLGQPGQEVGRARPRVRRRPRRR